jgi:hypothetical protein
MPQQTINITMGLTPLDLFWLITVPLLLIAAVISTRN